MSSLYSLVIGLQTRYKLSYKGRNDFILAIENHYISESCYKEFGIIFTSKSNRN